jgi:tyrosine decarboxylase / aspartate 1-decarboxylase
MPTIPESHPFSKLLNRSLTTLADQFSALPVLASPLEDATSFAAMADVLEEAARRMGDNYPYFHPLYAGQMLKPPHPVAQAAYAMAMSINPNNHARDGGRASSQMEIEAVAEIARMFGFAQHLGHLTSSGTFANLEALWVAGELSPGKRILTSVLKIPFASVQADSLGRMDLNALEDELKQGDIGTVVVTMGTTAIGAVDPLPQILVLRERYGFRIHLDAAYGGYFRLIAEYLDEPARRAFQLTAEADSIVVDPHKHGLQPYGCGCVLFRDPTVGRFYKHDSPYTYFTSNELHLGEISLECSRAGASAVALWATQRLLPLVLGGEFATGLLASRRAALDLHARISRDNRFVPFTGRPEPGPELDIVVWQVKSPSKEESSAAAQRIFDRCAELDLHLALVQLPKAMFAPDSGDSQRNGRSGLPSGLLSNSAIDETGDAMGTCLRSVLMKPQHADWLDEIWMRLDHATGSGS